MRKWFATSELAQLIEDHSPVNAQDLREYCEDGTIPSKLAKRKPGRERGHWFFSLKGVRFLLEKVLELDAEEIAEVQAKASINFNQRVA